MEVIGKTVKLNEPYQGYDIAVVVGQMGNRYEVRIEGSGKYLFLFRDQFEVV
jgi:hypothetical protein